MGTLTLPNNLKYALATAYETSVNVTAATNATECVLTTATNDFALGDIVEYTCSWSKANGRLFRLKAATTTSATLEAFDTTDAVQFPAGAGTGSLRKVTTWTQVVQVLGCDVSGGDAKYAAVNLMDNDTEISLPDGFSATNLNLNIADDPGQPHHAALKANTGTGKLVGLRITLPSGGILLYSGFVSFNENPSQAKGQPMGVKAGFAVRGQVVRYAA